MIKYETVKEAAKRTGLCRNTLMQFDREGITYRIGRALRFDADALDAAIAEMSAKSRANNSENK